MLRCFHGRITKASRFAIMIPTMDSDNETNTPLCPACGESTHRAAGARALPGEERAFCLQFRWACPKCGHEHVDAALRRFNHAQAQAVRLMRSQAVSDVESLAPPSPAAA